MQFWSVYDKNLDLNLHLNNKIISSIKDGSKLHKPNSYRTAAKNVLPATVYLAYWHYCLHLNDCKN